MLQPVQCFCPPTPFDAPAAAVSGYRVLGRAVGVAEDPIIVEGRGMRLPNGLVRLPALPCGRDCVLRRQASGSRHPEPAHPPLNHPSLCADSHAPGRLALHGGQPICGHCLRPQRRRRLHALQCCPRRDVSCGWMGGISASCQPPMRWLARACFQLASCRALPLTTASFPQDAGGPGDCIWRAGAPRRRRSLWRGPADNGLPPRRRAG